MTKRVVVRHRWIILGAAMVAIALGVAAQQPAVRRIALGAIARFRSMPNGPLSLGGDTLTVADRAVGACSALALAAKHACYEGILMPMVAARGVRTAMGTLHRLGDLDRDVRFSGHEYAHMIGITAYHNHPDVSATFAECTGIFQSGCYHGVIQTYLRSLPHVGRAEINAVCVSYTSPTADRWLRFQCVHGMGHGLTMFHDHDLPAALAGCDSLNDSWDRKSCYGGAFMENIVHATNPHDDHDPLNVGSMPGMSSSEHHDMKPSASHAADFKPIDARDPQYPCSILAEQYLDDCYQTQPAVMLTIDGGDYGKTFVSCNAAPPALRRRCYQGTGTSISGETLMDHKRSIELCGLGDPQYQPWCYIGVVKNFVDVTANPDDGFAFCRDVPGGSNQAACYAAVGEEIAVLRNTSPEREALCAKADTTGLAACRYGAQLSSDPPRELPL